MKKRTLGMDGPKVGAIGLGCMNFAGFYGPADETESHATLAQAFELGMDFLDTSNVYGMGRSEEIMGRFFKSNPSCRFTIATKAGITRDPKTNERGFNNSESHLREELEKSLKRLCVDYVELFYVHRRDQTIPIEDVTGTLVKLKDEGKIGGFGFSEISPASLKRAHKVHPVMAVQSEYSLWTRQPELGMIQTCRDLGTTFVPFSPVARGMLGREPVNRTHFEKTDFRLNNPRFMEPNLSANIVHFDKLRAFAAERNTSPAAIGMAWILAQGEHLIPIPGTRSVAHLEQCANGANLTLNDDDLATINQIMPVGFAHGSRYSDAQWIGVEQYC